MSKDWETLKEIHKRQWMLSPKSLPNQEFPDLYYDLLGNRLCLSCKSYQPDETERDQNVIMKKMH